MASLRNLKAEIDELMSMVLSDCMFVLEYNTKVDQIVVAGIADRVTRIHRELRIRANHPDGRDNPKLVRQFYTNLRNDLLKVADEALEELSKAVEKTR